MKGRIGGRIRGRIHGRINGRIHGRIHGRILAQIMARSRRNAQRARTRNDTRVRSEGPVGMESDLGGAHFKISKGAFAIERERVTSPTQARCSQQCSANW